MSQHQVAFTVATTWPCSNLRTDTLHLAWCNQQVVWQVLNDLCHPGSGPDIVLDDPTFCPALSSSSSSSPEEKQLTELLASWSSSPHQQQLHKLVQLLGNLFKQHNQLKLAALTDDRVHFELGTLDVTGCDQLLYVDAREPKDRRACFSIPLDIPDLQQLAAPLLQYQQQQQQQQAPGKAATAPGSGSGSGNGGDASSSTGAAAGGSGDGGNTSSNSSSGSGGGEFRLTACFRLGAGTSHIPPDLHLQSPAWFKAGLPPFPPPAWNLQAPLMEYVPHLVERLQQHFTTHAAAAALKYQLVEAMGGLLGPPLEVYIPGSSANASSTSSTSSSSSSSKSGAAVFHLQYDQQPLLLFLELGPRFPEELPLLTVQSIRRPGPEGMKAFTSFPWSPRWPAAEMAARIFNFLKQQLASCAEQLLGTAPTTAAAAGAGAAVPAAAAVPVAGVAGTVPGLLPAGVSSSSSSGVVPSPHVAASGSGEGAASPAAVPGAGTPPS